jgi:hypothetical protein
VINYSFEDIDLSNENDCFQTTHLLKPLTEKDGRIQELDDEDYANIVLNVLLVHPTIKIQGVVLAGLEELIHHAKIVDILEHRDLMAGELSLIEWR